MAYAVGCKALVVDESLEVDELDSIVCESPPGNLEVDVDHENLVKGGVDPPTDEVY